jgi:ComF family protein
MQNRQTLWSKWSDGLRQSLSFMLQAQCSLCDRPSPSVFCKDCARRLQACRRPASVLQVEDLPPLYVWGNYEGALKQSLAQLKYSHRHLVAEPLGQWLGQLWLDSAPINRNLVAVPIPLHGDRQQQRGYNQAELIARSLCQVTGMPLRANGLTRTLATTAQFGLSRRERYQNLRNVFQVGTDLQKHKSQKDIVLVDDIFTTGATLKSATETLQQSGFRVVALVAIAISERQTA